MLENQDSYADRAKRTDSVNKNGSAFGGGGLGSVHEKSLGHAGLRAWIRSLNLTGPAEITHPYIQSPWVYACVQAISRAVVGVPMRIRREEDPSSEIIRSGPVWGLLTKPNPIMTRRKLVKTSVINHQLWGENFWILLGSQASTGRPTSTSVRLKPIEEGEMPVEAWPVRPDLMEPDKMDSGTHLVLTWKLRGSETVFPAHSVFHAYDVNPYATLRGIGPMQAAERAMQRAFTAERYNEALLGAGGDPGGVYTYEHTLTEPEKERLRESHRMRTTPDGGNLFRAPLVLEDGLKYTSTGFAPKDMEHHSMSEWDRDTIMAVFGVTKPILAITDDVNRANSYEAVRVFWEIAVIPFMDFLEDEINMHFLPMIGGDEGHYVFFDRANVEALQSSLSAKIEMAATLMTKMQRPFREAARITGIVAEDIEGEEDRYISTSMQPVELAFAGPADDVDEPDPEEDEVDDDDGDKASSKAAIYGHQWRRRYAEEFNSSLKAHDDRLASKSSRVMTEFVIVVRKRLEAIAKNAKLDDVPEEKAMRRREIEREIKRIVEEDLESWVEQMKSATSPPMDSIWTFAAEVIHTSTGGAGSLVVAASDEAVEFLGVKKLKLAEGSMSALADAVKSKILKVVSKQPISVGGLSLRISEVLTELRESMKVMKNSIPARALRIARTENTSISNAARVAQMSEDGVEKHMWVDSGDGVVRDEHEKLDGSVRKVGDVFGFNLRFPGDPNGAAAVVVNCRCTTAPIVEP